MSDEISKSKNVHEDYRLKIIEEIRLINEDAGKTKVDLNKHMEEYKATFQNNVFFMDKTDGQMRNFERDVESFKAFMDGKIE